MNYSRRNVVIGGVGMAATAALVGCNSKSDGASKSAAEAHPASYPPDVLPLNVPAGSSNKFNVEGLTDPYVDEIGRGFDSVFDETRMFFVDGEIVRSEHNSIGGDTADRLDYSMTETQDSYYAFTKKSARAKARWKIFSGEGRGRKTSEKTSNSYTLHICALARRFDPSHNLRNGTLRFTSEGERLLSRYKDRPNELLRLLGDSYVAGIIPGAELLIDIRYETASRSAKGQASVDLKAAVSGLGSGSMSYGQAINATSAAKRVTMNIVGLDGLDIPQQYTADRATALIQQFLRNTDVATKTAFMSYRPIDELTRNGRPLNFVNWEAHKRRDRFVAVAEAQLEYLDRTEADAEYVLANPAEFDSPTKERAQGDLAALKIARDRIFDIGEAAYARFRQTGTHEFDPNVFTGIPPAFNTYEQIEPAKPTPAPAPKRPKPEPRSRCNGSCHPGPR